MTDLVMLFLSGIWLVKHKMLITYMCFVKGFSFGDWRILYQEGAFSRICSTICVQCRGFTEVPSIISYRHLSGVLNFYYMLSFHPQRNYFGLFYRVGRKLEAKDAARGALKSPWWTLGCKYQVWTLCMIFPALTL